MQTPDVLTGLGQVLFDRIEERRVECGQPHDNARLMQSLNRGAWTVTARQSRYGEYCSFTALVSVPGVPEQVPADDQTFSKEWVADLELGYKWRKYSISAGVENLFDNFPDRNKVFRDGAPGVYTAQSNFGMFVYPSHSPFGMNGRFVYTRIAYTF